MFLEEERVLGRIQVCRAKHKSEHEIGGRRPTRSGWRWSGWEKHLGCEKSSSVDTSLIKGENSVSGLGGGYSHRGPEASSGTVRAGRKEGP